MKRFMLGSALALACSVGLAAQSATVKSETKVDVKDGKDVTVTGCLARSASGTAYLLNNVEGKGVTSKSYILVGGRPGRAHRPLYRDQGQGEQHRRRRQGRSEDEDQDRAR